MFPHYNDTIISFSELPVDSTDGNVDVAVFIPDSSSPLGTGVAWEFYWSPLFVNLALAGETAIVANEHIGLEWRLLYDVTLAAATANSWQQGGAACSFLQNANWVDSLYATDVMNPVVATGGDGENLQWGDGWNLQIPYSYHWDKDDLPLMDRLLGDGTAGYVTAVVLRMLEAPSADTTISGSVGIRAWPVERD